MMRPRVLSLLLSFVLAVPTIDACDITFDAIIQEVPNGTTQELCEILLEGIGIENSDASFVCVQERYAGTMEDTLYGPLPFVDGTAQVSTRAVAQRTVGADRFVPFVYPFRGSILATKYTVWPAFNDTFCGEVSECNRTKVVNVDVFDCVIPPPTPSPTLLLTPTTLVPNPTETILGPSSSGVMASRPPTDPPVVPPPTKVVTKSPNKTPVAPSPTIMPLANTNPSPPSNQPAVLTIPNIQASPSGAFRLTTISVLLMLFLSSLLS